MNVKCHTQACYFNDATECTHPDWGETADEQCAYHTGERIKEE